MCNIILLCIFCGDVFELQIGHTVLTYRTTDIVMCRSQTEVLWKKERGSWQLVVKAMTQLGYAFTASDCHQNGAVC